MPWSAGRSSSLAGDGRRASGLIAGTRLCEYHHQGYAFQGHAHIELEDGSSFDIGPNEAYEIPPGHDAWVVGDDAWIALDWAGMRSFARPVAGSGERVLSTILFTDIVDSTATAASASAMRAWRELLARHNETRPFRAGPIPGPRDRHDGRRVPGALRQLRTSRPRRRRHLPGRQGASASRRAQASTPARSSW